MTNQKDAEVLDDPDATLANSIDVPIDDVEPRWLRAMGFEEESIETIRAIKEGKRWFALTKINGVGPKTAQELYDKYDIATIEDLRLALDSSHDPIKISNKSHIRRALEWVDEPRLPWEQADHIIEHIFDNMGEHFSRFKAVGSYRRKKETVGDIDMLGVHDSPTSEVQDAFKRMCDYTIRCGERKMTGRFMDTQVDIQLVTKTEWPTALQYFTGSQDHNIKLRRCAKADGLKLNEYGLWERNTENRIKLSTEKELYNKLLGEFIEPENRF